MKFLGTVASLILATAGISQASPVSSRQALEHFSLETQVLNGTNDCGNNKGALYIFSYHTGAGQGIAAGLNTPVSGTYFYLNDTTLLWTYEGNEIGPWPVIIEYGAYRAYNEIQISIATDEYATPGFYLDGNILKSNASENGWLVCDSYYTSPQLFAFNGPSNGNFPTSCSLVQLVTVPVA